MLAGYSTLEIGAAQLRFVTDISPKPPLNRSPVLFGFRAGADATIYYCSSVWHFCGARNANKVDNLNKRILRFILQDYSSPYDILLSKVNMKSLFIRRLQNFMITLYKSLFFTNYLGYLKDMFTVRSSSYNLRGNHILALPNPKTTTYGLHSFSYLASKIWNSHPDTYKTLNFLEFKQEVLRYEVFPQ